jgi:hypothetical protein
VPLLVVLKDCCLDLQEQLLVLLALLNYLDVAK